MCTASTHLEMKRAQQLSDRQSWAPSQSGRGALAARRRLFLRQRRMRHARGLALVALLATAASPMTSLAASKGKPAPVPIDITADHGQFNNATGVATYTGHVVLVRAKLTLTGDRLVVHRRNQTAPITAVLTGDPAHLHQDVTSQIKQVVRGTARKITYSGQNGTVHLENHAVVHRGDDLLQADEVTYSLNNGEITANTAKTSHGRVHMILNPQKRQKGQGGGS